MARAGNGLDSGHRPKKDVPEATNLIPLSTIFIAKPRETEQEKMERWTKRNLNKRHAVLFPLKMFLLCR